MKQLFFTVCLVNEHVPPSWIITTAPARSWMTWVWVQCVFPEMLKHLSREIENHGLSLESVELSRWAMNCTASFQLMSNTDLTTQERSFAPQREKNPQQENQRPPCQTKWVWINPLSLLQESVFAVCQPKHVSLWSCIAYLPVPAWASGREASLDLNWTWPHSNWKYLLTPSDNSLPC